MEGIIGKVFQLDLGKIGRREPDYGYLVGTWEWAGQGVTGLEQRTGLRTHRFQKINNRTLPFLPTLVQFASSC